MKRYIIISFLVTSLLMVLSSAGFCGAAMVRGGDMTAHGYQLPNSTGSPTVLIGGFPAWRAQTDQFCCPLFLLNPLTSHGCGMVLSGSNTVLINGKPAVYSGCSIAEPFGGLNTIITGCSTVLCGP